VTARPDTVAVVITLLALALRLPGMFHDFWFDEVWSYLLVREFVTAPAEILTRLHIDNNHPLNSLWIYVVGDRPWWPVYRIPALVLGVASVGLAGRILSRRGRAHAVIVMLLAAFSYPLVVYSSEARGYAPMVFFVLLAVDAHERYFAGGGWAARVTLWVAAILGLTSHLTFLHAYLAMCLWSLGASRTRHRDPVGGLQDAVALHSVPLLFLGAYYLGFMRYVRIAGAEPAGLFGVLGETVSVTLGAASRGPWRWIAIAVCVYLIASGLRIVATHGRALATFYAAGMLLIPALTVIVEYRTALFEPRFFPRYFLVSVTLFLLLAAWKLGEDYGRAGLRRVVSVTVLGGYIAGSLWQVFHFAAEGRGHYLEAVRYVSAESASRDVRVTSNSDFRTGRLLAFYGRYLPAERTVALDPLGTVAPDRAEWRIVERVEPSDTMPEEISDREKRSYRLMKRYPFYGLSGSEWSLYRRDDSVSLPDSGQVPQ
jgi:hypothetical protein